MPVTRSSVRPARLLRPPALSLFVPRTVFLWIVVRITLGAFLAAVPGLADPDAGAAARLLAIEPPTALLVAASVAVLTLADVHALRERVFLANLGMGPATPIAIAFFVSIGLESAIAVVLGLVA